MSPRRPPFRAATRRWRRQKCPRRTNRGVGPTLSSARIVNATAGGPGPLLHRTTGFPSRGVVAKAVETPSIRCFARRGLRQVVRLLAQALKPVAVLQFNPGTHHLLRMQSAKFRRNDLKVCKGF